MCAYCLPISASQVTACLLGHSYTHCTTVRDWGQDAGQVVKQDAYDSTIKQIQVTLQKV